jgi:xylulokinase
VHAFCHALPGRWHQMSVMLSAASALTWATRLTGHAGEAALLAGAEALTREQRLRAPLFLPYLAGERTPHNDPYAQGALFGLTHEHGPGAIAHAVIEGVSFGLLDGFMALDSGLRACATQLDLVGGGSRSDYWAQWLAAVLGVTLVRREGASSSAALGAARLAWLADGGAEDEVCRVAPVLRAFEPEPETQVADALRERRQRFRELYAVTRSLTPRPGS